MFPVANVMEKPTEVCCSLAALGKYPAARALRGRTRLAWRSRSQSKPGVALCPPGPARSREKPREKGIPSVILSDPK